MFLKILKDALKVKTVRHKILYTIFIILVFRIGTHITVPGVNAKSLEQLSDLPFLNMLNLVSGNAMRNFSVFSMGVSPYITAKGSVKNLLVKLLRISVAYVHQNLIKVKVFDTLVNMYVLKKVKLVNNRSNGFFQIFKKKPTFYFHFVAKYI